jgi:hypothetical protein
VAFEALQGQSEPRSRLSGATGGLADAFLTATPRTGTQRLAQSRRRFWPSYRVANPKANQHTVRSAYAYGTPQRLSFQIKVF